MVITDVESTLTDRYQTTVPKIVRRVLGLGKRDKIRYTLRENGEVVLSRATLPEDDDPVLEQFLDFLARDIANHPERLRSFGPGLVNRIRSLVGGVEADLETALPED